MSIGRRNAHLAGALGKLWLREKFAAREFIFGHLRFNARLCLCTPRQFSTISKIRETRATWLMPLRWPKRQIPYAETFCGWRCAWKTAASRKRDSKRRDASLL